ncbi:MAG: PEGA domain-containing protein [Aquificae bacterium]|nr:PEGA domain-containing protein [Aquificota bacterium]
MIPKTLTLPLLFLLFGVSTVLSQEKIQIGHHYEIEYVKYLAQANSSQSIADKGTGTIEGIVLFVGDKVPKNRRKLITKDKHVCGKGFKIDKVYIIGKNNGVKNAVVYIDGITVRKKEEKTLIQKNCEFHPRVFAMNFGSTLKVINQDPVKHEATGVQDFETIFKLSQHKQGMVDEVVLDKPGIVKITCSIHGWMISWGVIPSNPYYAITDENGSFTIKNVPAGTYTLKLWHEGFGEDEITVSVKPDKTVKVKFEIE